MSTRQPHYSAELRAILAVIREKGSARSRYEELRDLEARELRPLLQRAWDLGRPAGMTMQELGDYALYTRQRIDQLVISTSLDSSAADSSNESTADKLRTQVSKEQGDA